MKKISSSTSEDAVQRNGKSPSERHVTIYEPEHLTRYASVAPYIPTYIAAVKADLDVSLEHVMKQQSDRFSPPCGISSPSFNLRSLTGHPNGDPLTTTKKNAIGVANGREGGVKAEKGEKGEWGSKGGETENGFGSAFSFTNGSTGPLTDTVSSWVEDDESFVRYVVTTQSKKGQKKNSQQAVYTDPQRWAPRGGANPSADYSSFRDKDNDASEAPRSTANWNRRRKGRRSQWRTVGSGRGN